LRQDYQKFVNRNAEILIVGPDSLAAFKKRWAKEEIPYVGLANPEHDVAEMYKQEVNPLKLGRMPALLVIDREGRIRYQHYGDSQRDIPADGEVLAVLDGVNAESSAA
jgi:peroxiredoxin